MNCYVDYKDKTVSITDVTTRDDHYIQKLILDMGDIFNKQAPVSSEPIRTRGYTGEVLRLPDVTYITSPLKRPMVKAMYKLNAIFDMRGYVTVQEYYDALDSSVWGVTSLWSQQDIHTVGFNKCGWAGCRAYIHYTGHAYQLIFSGDLRTIS